jgi:hypothetical protein
MTYDHGFTEPAQLIGKRIEIPVHYDAWMRGARFGLCTAVRKGKPGLSDCVLVKLDHPQIRKRLKLWRMDIPYARVEVVA